MHWTISNILGAAGWVAGLSCLKGGHALAVETMSLPTENHFAMGALLCVGSASVMLWTNIDRR